MTSRTRLLTPLYKLAMAMRPSHSLGSRILLQMAIRVAIIIMVASTLGYYYVYRSVEEGFLENLAKYVSERGERESQPFLNIQNNLRIILNAYIDEIATPIPADTDREFNRLFVHSPDGAWRRRPEGHDIHNQSSSFVSSLTPLTPDAKRRVLSTDHLTTAYGRAWKAQMETVYLASMDNLYSTYWPDLDWSRETKSTQKFSELPWVINANQVNNPSRSYAWTSIWFDWVAKSWFTTCILPIDVGGEFRHYAGGAIALDAILKRTLTRQMDGTYNMIIRPDGRLISHPEYVEQIKQAEGKYNLNERGDAHLKALFQAVKHGGRTGVIDLKAFDEYLGVARIEGPGWYFVTVFPKKLIAAPAKKAAQTFLWLGLFSLTLELLILFFIIRWQIMAPLRQLGNSAARIREGDLSARCNMARNDELGDLSVSFNKMADTVQMNSEALKSNNQMLESRVAERTRELADRNVQITRSLTLQQATLESNQDAILVVDMCGKWLLHNQCFVSMWQFTDEFIATMDESATLQHMLNQVEDADNLVNKLCELYTTPKDDSSDEIKFKDGKIVERNSRSQLMDGKVIGRVWYFRDVTEQRKRDIDWAANRELLHEIEHRQTVSDERQRIMQDMHDGLGSSLVSALRAVEHGRMGEAAVVDVLRGCIDDLKLAIDSMEPVEADLLLLLATLRFRLGPRLESTGIALRWKVENVPKLCWLNPKNSLHILRILQESFTNIIKHTQATEIRLATRVEGNFVAVTIADNGQGFIVEDALKNGGKGLSNQRHRTEAICSIIHWESNNAGTLMTLSLPITPEISG